MLVIAGTKQQYLLHCLLIGGGYRKTYYSGSHNVGNRSICLFIRRGDQNLTSILEKIPYMLGKNEFKKEKKK